MLNAVATTMYILTSLSSVYLDEKCFVKVYGIIIDFNCVWIATLILTLVIILIPENKNLSYLKKIIIIVQVLLFLITIYIVIKVYFASSFASSSIIIKNSILEVKKAYWDYEELEKILENLEKELRLEKIPKEVKEMILSHSKNPEDLLCGLQIYVVYLLKKLARKDPIFNYIQVLFTVITVLISVYSSVNMKHMFWGIICSLLAGDLVYTEKQKFEDFNELMDALSKENKDIEELTSGMLLLKIIISIFGF